MKFGNFRFKGLSFGKLEDARPYQVDTELAGSEKQDDKFSESEATSVSDSLMNMVEDMAISYWV